MAFEFQDISANFQLLNNFLVNGFEGDKLLEHSQKVSLPYIEIISNEWYFEGIRMVYAEWHYDRPVELKWNSDIKIELITLICNLKGSAIISNKADKHFQIMGSYQHNLFYSQHNIADEGVLKFEGSHSSMFMIQFTKDSFLRITQDANDALNRFNENVFNSKTAILSPVNLPLNAPMQNIICNIVNCRYKDDLKKMFLLSKCIEFLVLQAEACNYSTDDSSGYIKTDYDKDCIMYAREYIMSNLEAPPSLSDLSKIVGINEYKLKRGFKELFGNTVFGYLSDARLEIAKNDLLKSKKTAGSIASELGYSSIQHFSNSFKKKFGFSPNKLKS